MWGRIVELMTAVWLMLSPFIFRAQGNPEIVWVDTLTGLVICALAGLSWWKPTRYAHVLTLFVATGLAIYGRMAGTPPPPEHQNHIVVGLFLLMVAIVPNDASRPPEVWRTRVMDRAGEIQLPASECRWSRRTLVVSKRTNPGDSGDSGR